MHSLLALSLLLSTTAVSGQPWPWDSRNVSWSSYPCNPTLGINFGGGVVPSCGSEVDQVVSATRPTFGYRPAVAGALYTVLVVDRDATSASAPLNSPLLHYAVVNVTGAALEIGFSADTPFGVLFSYSGPRPPAGTLCHRYYAFLMLQGPGSAGAYVTAVPTNSTTRFRFDFVAWAAQWNMSFVSMNYWSTQNNTTRVGGCVAAPTPAPTGSGGDGGLWRGVGLGCALVVAACVGVGWRTFRKAPTATWQKGGGVTAVVNALFLSVKGGESPLPRVGSSSSSPTRRALSVATLATPPGAAPPTVQVVGIPGIVEAAQGE